MKMSDVIKRHSALVLAAVFWMGASGTTVAAGFTLLTEELPPYSMSENGKPAGATVDIVGELFSRAGLEQEVKIVPWKRAYIAAQNESNSCVFPVQRSQENEVLFKWISPVVITHSAFFTMDDADTNIRTLADAENLRIGSYIGSGDANYLEGQGFDVALTPNDVSNLKKLDSGRLDAWAADTLTAPYLAKKVGITGLNEELVYFTTLRALACNLETDDSTVETLNQTLKSMYSDGTIEEIMNKYR